MIEENKDKSLDNKPIRINKSNISEFVNGNNIYKEIQLAEKNMKLSLYRAFKSLSNYNQTEQFLSMHNSLRKLGCYIREHGDYINISLSNQISNMQNNFYKNLINSLKLLSAFPYKLIPDTIDKYSLDKYFWTMPFDISIDDLIVILGKIETEEDFDNEMEKYFTDDKLEKLILEINTKISEEHKIFFEQIVIGYKNKLYSLANAGLLSIIDGLCSYYVFERGTKRKNLFETISENEKDEKTKRKLIMLNNNINIIYESFKFSGEIIIGTNKKTRRHLSQHGITYSNKKIDCIMLMNIVYHLLSINIKLEKYKETLVFDYANKKFKIKEN